MSNLPKRNTKVIQNNLELNFITTYHLNPINPTWAPVPDPIPVLVDISSAVRLNVTAYREFENITVTLIEEVPSPLGDDWDYLEVENNTTPQVYNIGRMTTNESRIITWYLYARFYPRDQPTRLMSVIGTNTVDGATTIIFPVFTEMQLAQILDPRIVVSASSSYIYQESVYSWLKYQETQEITYYINSTGRTPVTSITITINVTESDYVIINSLSNTTSWQQEGYIKAIELNDSYFLGMIDSLPPSNYTALNVLVTPIQDTAREIPIEIKISHRLTELDVYNTSLIIVIVTESDQLALTGVFITASLIGLGGGFLLVIVVQRNLGERIAEK